MEQKASTHQTNRILHIILLLFLLLVFRLWQLTYLDREEYLEFSHVPRKRTILEKPKRGAIFDRFGQPLALNRICYNACIYYKDICQIPQISWKNGEKKTPRKEYIEKLSSLLGGILQLSPQRVEDLIYAKAALFPHLPFPIKENITEKEYFRLRILEREWAGLHAEKTSQRYYPKGKVACDILGFLGAINQEEYLSLANEIQYLNELLENEELPLPPCYSNLEELLCRLRELKEKAYAINDRVGKSGIEASFEKELRGYMGFSQYEINRKGVFLKKLKGSKEAIGGKNCILSLSSELQQFAEELLAESEEKRENICQGFDKKLRKTLSLKEPWMKGGSIVVIDPNTAEVLALASYPRFDPNDFAKPNKSKEEIFHIHKWLESEKHIARIWDGKEALTKERFSLSKGFYELATPLTWSFYLKSLLSLHSPLYELLSKMRLQNAVDLQEEWERLLFLYPKKEPHEVIDLLFAKESSFSEEVEKMQLKWSYLFAEIPHNGDKLLAIDLCRLAIYSALFSDELLQEVGELSLEEYFSLSRLVLFAKEALKEKMRASFHDFLFIPWREENQKTFLEEKRREEKIDKKPAKPFVDYLDQEEERQFSLFWQKNAIGLLHHFLQTFPNEIFPLEEKLSPLLSLQKKISSDLFEDFLHTVRGFEELTRPLFSKKFLAAKREKDLAKLFYPKTSFGYGKSYAYREACPLGSIFKLVTAFAALKEYGANREFPFQMVDEYRWDQKAIKQGGLVVGYTKEGKPYPRFYKGGRLPRSTNRKMGWIDLCKALERSSNPYFAILASDFLKDPMDLRKIAYQLGFGEKTGIDLPGEIAGILPGDLKENRTGLYSFSIGQHSLVVTPLQTALMLAALCHGKLFVPEILLGMQGKTRNSFYPMAVEEDPIYQKELSLLGIPFGLFAKELYLQQEEYKLFSPKIKREIPITSQIQKQLFQGMDLVIWGEQGNARPQVIKGLLHNRELFARYENFRHQFIGKTSTAEIMQKLSIEPSAVAEKYKDVWFGAIAFDSEKKQKPELVVVVYLKYGDAGKEAAPYAMRVIEKFRQIRKKYLE